MGCLNIKVSTNICDCNAECSCTNGINVITQIMPVSNAHVTPKISSITVKCGLVCSVADVLYVKVSPQEVQWITEDEIIMYNVESNTNWIIELNYGKSKLVGG